MADSACTPELRSQDIGWRVEVAALTTWIPLLIAATARTIVRGRSPSGYGVDDYLMAVAFIAISISTSFHLTSVHYGLGQHYVCLDPYQQVMVVKWQDLAECMCLISVWIVKLSICFFLLRILQRLHRKARIFIWVLIVFSSLLNLSALIVWCLLKYPIQSRWDPNVPTTLNILVPGTTYFQFAFVVNVVIDFVFAFSPIYFLWNVKIHRSRKHTLWGLMLLGIIPSIAGVLKIVYLAQANHPSDLSCSFVANIACLGVMFDTARVSVIRHCANFRDSVLGRRGAENVTGSENEHAEEEEEEQEGEEEEEEYNIILAHASDAGTGDRSKAFDCGRESMNSSLVEKSV